MKEWRKHGGDLAAKPGCDKPECYGQICVEPERCYGEGQPSDLTPERLAELRRIASAATPGPWAVNPFKALVDEMATLTPVCALLWPTDLRTEEQTLANAEHIAAFDPTTALELLDALDAARDVVRLHDEHIDPGMAGPYALAAHREAKRKSIERLKEALKRLDAEKVIVEDDGGTP